MDCVTEEADCQRSKMVAPYLRMSSDGSCSSIELVFESGNSFTRLESALSVFGSLMSIVVPLKYDRELNYSFLESLKIH